jgi:hypothetical protein
MGLAPRHRLGRSAAEGLPAKVRAALALLAEAYDYSQDTDSDAWEFAVEIDTLETEGLTPNDLRWLVYRDYVEHARETTKSGAGRREFRRCRGRTLYKRSCFILTDAGLALAQSVANTPEASAARDDPEHASVPHPHWDAELHELSFDGQLVKRFQTPAPNQAAVLAAFEEEGWPPRIDDPLPRHPDQDQDPKRRLNDTVKALNRHQKTHLVHFSCDGTGEGVRWESVGGSLSHLGK